MHAQPSPYAGQLFNLNGKTFMVTDRASGSPENVVVRALANRNKLEEISVDKVIANLSDDQ